MNLTISILIYDNDNYVNYVNRLLNSIDKNLKNYKTLLLIDDRRNQKIPLNEIFDLSKFNYEIVKHGENKGILQGYLSSIEYSKTDWLWVLDMDDEVTNFDFDTIHLKNDIDMIYFTHSYDTLQKFYENKPDKGIFKYDKFYVILGKMLNPFEQIFKEAEYDSVKIILNKKYDRKYLFSQYDYFLVPIWERILNVDYCKKHILRKDFSKFGKLNMSADSLISLIIFDNLKSVLIINKCLPYIHYHNNSENYFSDVYRDGKYIPNMNVSEETKKSWGILDKYLDNVLDDEDFKKIWKKKLLKTYAKCGIDFTKYGMKIKEE